MQDETMVRCIEPACGRALAHRVHFCPYCGTPQHADAVRAQPPVPAAMPVAAAVDGAAVSPQPEPAAAADSPAVPAAPAPQETVVPPASAAQAQAVAGPTVPPVAPPRPAPPAAPPPASRAAPQRQPIRLRWWLLALAVLWAVWLLANPKRRIEAQMDKAVALAAECKAREAQSELIALRKTRATPEQLRQVQTALNESGAACTRKRQRAKAWNEAKDAVEAALAEDAVERARQRLRVFTRRWGEDASTRALKETIDARRPEHPRADEVE